MSAEASSSAFALRKFLNRRPRQIRHRGHAEFTEIAEKTPCPPCILGVLCVKNFNGRFRSSLIATILACLILPTSLAQRTSTVPRPSFRTITIKSQPGAIVWLDDVRRGTADKEGTLEIKKVSPGAHMLRVRAGGYAERTMRLVATQRGVVNVTLRSTTDEAELTFQRAEEQREKGGGDEGRKAAAELYRRALKLRPRFPAAHVGLARVLLSQEDFDAALEQIDEARRDRPVYPEASAVEGRILRAMPDEVGAMNSYRRAIREGKGFQPEAHTGLGIVREERGDHEGAVASFSRAIAQLSDTEPVLYEFLGRNLEKLEKWKEAVAAYEKYLELEPAGSHASAINSIIEQLRLQAAEPQ